MNIAIVVSEPPCPSNTGGRIYTMKRIKMLKDMGHSIYLYGFKKDEELGNELFELCECVKFYERNMNFTDNLLNILKPFTAYSRFSRLMLKDLEDDISTNNYDFIILDMPQVYYNLPKSTKIPIIMSQHNIEYKTFVNIGKNSKKLTKKLAFIFEGIKLKYFENRIYKENRIDWYTFISSDDLKFFKKKFNKTNCSLIPFGYNSKVVEKDIENNTIVFSGKMDYQPNIDAVIWFTKKVFPKIKKDINNVEFYIVGKNPTKEVRDLEQQGVIVTGTVPSVNEYIDKAKLIVIPLLSGGGVKIKLLEALGRNNVVVTTKKGIEGTEFKDKKHVLVSNIDEEFANKCIEVLRNREKFEYLTSNSLKIIEEKYSWESIGKLYDNILKELKGWN
ncbi:glycosyltransferase [Clostridium perfringens]|uniref:glycosyltransferase n=1 Tax=Clostridium perfringens TaxID=1502 RepID=UPI0024BC6FEF|nr:glycosyltransferase [Clostridium perfringens]